MSGVLKMSGAASLALHTTAILAENLDRLVSTKELASVLHASESHLSKVLQRLEKADIVSSTRGPRGGFKLSRASDEIVLRDVYEAIAGKLSLSDCILSENICDGNCILGKLITNLNMQFKNYLSSTKLSNLNSVYRSLSKYA